MMLRRNQTYHCVANSLICLSPGSAERSYAWIIDIIEMKVRVSFDRYMTSHCPSQHHFQLGLHLFPVPVLIVNYNIHRFTHITMLAKN